MKPKSMLPVVISILLCGNLFSQENTFLHFPAQLSLVYPLGTSGAGSVNYCYNFSLNALTGSTGCVDGCEIGGLTNINKGSMSGFQVAGIGNITRDSVAGVQLGGIYNITGNVKGLQAGGITNINNGNLKGVQIGGIYNKTKELDGLQIGLINFADTLKSGISIGFISIIKNGFYDEWTVSTADYMNFAISYKFGLKRFYNIYSAGFNFVEDQLWVVGLGFGHLSDLSPGFGFQPELIYYTYFPNDFRKPYMGTYVTHLKLGLVWNMSERMAMSIAPSIYWAIKSNRQVHSTYGYEQSPIDPVVTYYPGSSNSRIEVGYGISFGLNFR